MFSRRAFQTFQRTQAKPAKGSALWDVAWFGTVTGGTIGFLDGGVKPGKYTKTSQPVNFADRISGSIGGLIYGSVTGATAIIWIPYELLIKIPIEVIRGY